MEPEADDALTVALPDGATGEIVHLYDADGVEVGPDDWSEAHHAVVRTPSSWVGAPLSDLVLVEDEE